MKTLIFLITSLISINVFSQKKEQKKIDSLVSLLTTNQKTKSLGRAFTLNILGKVYLHTSEYVNSMQCFTECLSIADKFKNEDLIAASYKNMGIVFFYQHNYDKSKESYLKAFDIFNKKNNSDEKALLLKSIGDIYLEESDSSNANKYYNVALAVYKKLGDKEGEASVYSNQSILCNSDYQHKIELALAAKKIWDINVPDNVLPAINTGNLGVAYLDIFRYDTLHKTKPSQLIPADRNKLLPIAEKYLKEAIQMSNANNDIEDSSYFIGVLAELQAQKGDFKNAYYNFRKYQDITDSIYSQANKNKIAKLESQQAIDAKNTQIENEKLQLSNQRKNLWLLAGLIAFLMITGSLLYRQNRNRKKTNTTLLRLNKELDDANKVKVKFFGILSHDLRSPVANLINFLQLQKIKPGSMSEDQMAEYESKITNSAKCLLQNMEAMLLWSKGQMEHFKPDISEVSAKHLFSYLQKFFADAEHITFSFLCEDNLVFETDEHYMETIMQNLTANAIKALHETPDAKIEWKAWQEKDKRYFSISDNGPGIGNANLKSLYDETALSGFKHGLGLHIIRDLAKAVGCEITLNLKKMEGTEFILCLTEIKLNNEHRKS